MTKGFSRILIFSLFLCDAAVAFLSVPKAGDRWSQLRQTRVASAVEEAEKTSPAKTANTKVPNLPKDALILTSSDEATWKLECKEYKALAECEERKGSFAPLIESFELKGRYYHAFKNEGTSLEDADFGKLLTRGAGAPGEGAPLPTAVQDAVRIALIKDLIEGVVWCHLQGAPHLAIDAKGLRLVQGAPAPGKKFGFWRLALVGIGAGPQLVTRTAPYQVSNESWAFNPPETLSGALIKGNLPGLYSWDAWSVGVALAMICGGNTESPFEAEADIKDLTFSSQAAVSKKIARIFQNFSPFLAELNAQGGGFLFRHGWVVELIVGLLNQKPDNRLSVIQAREIMTAALAEQRSSSKAPKAAAAAPKSTVSASQGVRPAATPAAPAAAKAAAKALTAEETKALRIAFDQFDADKSGDLDPDEIVGAMAQVGVRISDEQATKLIADADTDGNGKLDFIEFVLMCQDLVSGQLLDSEDAEEQVADAADKLSAKAVFGRRLASAEGEPFRSLESMISIADKGLSEVVIERKDAEVVSRSRDPEARALVQFKNYGEVVGFRNRADGDRWDVLVPGLPNQLAVGSRHRLSAVLGVILVKGGNHKLVVALGGNKPDPAAVKADIDSFMEAYAASHANVRSGRRIRYLELEDPFARPAGSLDVDALPLRLDDDEGEDNVVYRGGAAGPAGDGKEKPKPPTAISNAF